nr:MAG TPA: hypothetical protein [Caudoviricetes sp.]
MLIVPNIKYYKSTAHQGVTWSKCEFAFLYLLSYFA